MAGLVCRPAKNHARMGLDSIAVIATYVMGIAGLIALK
jgi:cation:H+ antiporter